MKLFIVSALIGIAAGIIDAAPMIMRRMPRRSVLSAFFQYFIAAIIIAHISFPGVAWWIRGSAVALALSIPIAIIVSEREKTALPAIIANAIAIGFLIAAALRISGY
ncbi:MAG TPA: hypothetical protein PKK43_07760 [Spirochaetota bacterium]|nr:hypothetical protein [Spirochaetota bacterium]